MHIPSLSGSYLTGYFKILHEVMFSSTTLKVFIPSIYYHFIYRIGRCQVNIEGNFVNGQVPNFEDGGMKANRVRNDSEEHHTNIRKGTS